ncbi:MAG: 4Fe-4S dicluster-binding protein [Chlorobium sp.]|jgi:Na+-translocating ferredoxin:NAD+ oxidoreductase RNF subunit RnfB|nr:MAG: 4Fe-4S dicluster domain-containing protein [Chlorobium sp.]
MGNDEKIAAVQERTRVPRAAGARKRAAARVISELCTGCRICVQTCPSNSITIVESELNFTGIAQVDESCTGCNICAIDCPWTGVEMLNPDGSKKDEAEYERQLKRLRGYQ